MKFYNPFYVADTENKVFLRACLIITVIGVLIGSIILLCEFPLFFVPIIVGVVVSRIGYAIWFGK